MFIKGPKGKAGDFKFYKMDFYRMDSMDCDSRCLCNRNRIDTWAATKLGA